jgi:hypothetical protein
MEKTQNLVSGIEGFDSTKLRHTETNEKNPLPDKDGKFKTKSSYCMMKKKHEFYDNLHNFFSNFLLHEIIEWNEDEKLCVWLCFLF